MAATKAAVLPSGITDMRRAPLTHHRPKVRKSKGRFGRWWSTCITCGHAEYYSTWRRAYIDAIIHSERLN